MLDTGRAATINGTKIPASVGGSRLIGVDITSNQLSKTIVFPPNVIYSDSYINDIRLDLWSPIDEASGVVYIKDSSQEGRNGIVIVDLGTGESS